MFPFSLFNCSFMTQNSSKINSDDLSLGIDNPENQKKVQTFMYTVNVSKLPHYVFTKTL